MCHFHVGELCLQWQAVVSCERGVGMYSAASGNAVGVGDTHGTIVLNFLFISNLAGLCSLSLLGVVRRARRARYGSSLL